MNIAVPPPLPICTQCQTVLDPNGTCPRCRAPEDWNDQAEAIDFVLRRLREWQQAGQLTDRQLQSLSDEYARRRQACEASSAAHEFFEPDATFARRDECWSCREYLYTSAPYCPSCGAPATNPAVKSLRFWEFLYHELQMHEDSGAITLRQSHELLSDTRERIDALRRKLERDRAPTVIPVADDEPAPAPIQAPRRRRREEAEAPITVGPERTFLEILLDPQSIQWLLAAGGALIVLGLVIWLTSLGLLDNPVFVALLLGAGNLALLAGGYYMILGTRHQHAGLALTLLACLVMPLNLWFYHTHDLLTLDRHLWAAALVCCVVYVVSALILRNPLFVYVLVGGITLTGLLILAQMHHFGEIFAPTLLLVILGLICLHAERAFPPSTEGAPPEENPFSRERFGMAFYWSSQPLFAVGLLLLLGAQIVGWLHGPIFRHLGMAEPPDVATRAFLPWTLFIVLAGTYAYVYSDLVVRRIGVYLYLAAITLLWAEIHVLVLVAPGNMEAVVIITLALTGLLVNVMHSALGGKLDVLRTIVPLGLLLSILPVMFGVLLHFRATNVFLHDVILWGFDLNWWHVIAMIVTALACRAGAFLHRDIKEIAAIYFFATAAATLVAAAGLLWMLGLKPWEEEAPFVMLIPIAYLVASHLYKGRTEEKPLLWVAHASTAVMLICSLWAAIAGQTVAPVEGSAYHLLLSAFCLEATLFYGLAGFLHRSQVSLYLAAVMFCGAVWQLLVSFHTPDELYPVAFSLTGFILLVLYRVGVFEKLEMPTLERAVFQSAGALTTLGFVAGALLALSRFFLTEDAGGVWRGKIQIVIALLVFLTLVSLISAWLVQHPMWRRVYLVLSIINGLLLVLMFHKLSLLSPWQKLEIFSIILGLSLLILGHIGWWRETERASDLVSFALLFGAIGVVVPLLVASGIHRFRFNVSVLDELGLVTACIVLFASGVLCRIRATTIVGAVAMLIYILMVFIYLHRFMRETVIIGIYLTLGGALLFGIGLFLSIYRDRLLALPDRMRRREGIFRIFDWR